MKKFLSGLFLALVCTSVQAQDLNLADEELAQQILEDLERINAESTPEDAVGSVVPRDFVQLRFLDRLNAKTEVFETPIGQAVQKQHLRITADSCYVPASNANSDAIAFLDIQDDREEENSFDGYMVASSPALNALEHPRYDVWVVSCSKSATLQENMIPMAPPARPADLQELSAG